MATPEQPGVEIRTPEGQKARYTGFSSVNIEKNIGLHGVDETGSITSWNDQAPRAPDGMKENTSIASLLKTRYPKIQSYVYTGTTDTLVQLHGKKYEISLRIDNKLLKNDPVDTISSMYRAAVNHFEEVNKTHLKANKKIAALHTEIEGVDTFA